jgi:Rap1a immunity proteins
LSISAVVDLLKRRYEAFIETRRRMMRLGAWVGVLVLLAVCAPQLAGATNLTGAALLKECSSPSDSISHKQCESYIAGVVDGADTLMTSMKLLHAGSKAYPRLYCVPHSTPAKDLVASTVDYLLKHPATRRYGASSEVLLALEQAYPCRGS